MRIKIKLPVYSNINIKQLVKAGPFILLTGDGLAFFCTYFDWYEDFQWFHSQIVGHGMFVLIMWMFYARVHKYCMYSVASLYTLFTLNILNCVYFFVDLIYFQVYAGIIIFCGLLISALYLLKKWRNQAQY